MTNASIKNKRNARINIIFVRGSVNACEPFLNTLLEKTCLQFRLVSNGCSNTEEQHLKGVCDKHETLEFYTMNTSVTIEHGIVLDHLLSMETSDFFSFMDSDIFATGPVSSSELEPLVDEVAITSCLPVGLSIENAVLPESFQLMGGQFVYCSKKTFLGCTYFASYRTEPLRKLISDTGLSFRAYKLTELPNSIVSKLNDLELLKSRYETAKVINLMLSFQGYKLSYRHLNNLIHIGGISCLFTTRKGFKDRSKDIIKDFLPKIILNKIFRYRHRCNELEAGFYSEHLKRRPYVNRSLKKMNKKLSNLGQVSLEEQDIYLKKLADEISQHSSVYVIESSIEDMNV